MRPTYFSRIWSKTSYDDHGYVSHRERIKPLIYRSGLVFTLVIGCLIFAKYLKNVERMLLLQEYKEEVLQMGALPTLPQSGFHALTSIYQEKEKGIIWEEECELSFEVDEMELMALCNLQPPPPPPPVDPFQLPEEWELQVCYHPEGTPEFPGCEEVRDKSERKQCSEMKLMEFVYQGLKWPERAAEHCCSGTVVVGFVIDKKGRVTDPSILRQLDPEGYFGKEVLKVIEKMPDWYPGLQSGVPVDMHVSLPVKFVVD